MLRSVRSVMRCHSRLRSPCCSTHSPATRGRAHSDHGARNTARTTSVSRCRPAPGHRRRGRDCGHALPSPHVAGPCASSPGTARRSRALPAPSRQRAAPSCVRANRPESATRRPLVLLRGAPQLAVPCSTTWKHAHGISGLSSGATTGRTCCGKLAASHATTTHQDETMSPRTSGCLVEQLQHRSNLPRRRRRVWRLQHFGRPIHGSRSSSIILGVLLAPARAWEETGSAISTGVRKSHPRA